MILYDYICRETCVYTYCLSNSGVTFSLLQTVGTVFQVGGQPVTCICKHSLLQVRVNILAWFVNIMIYACGFTRELSIFAVKQCSYNWLQRPFFFSNSLLFLQGLRIAVELLLRLRVWKQDCGHCLSGPLGPFQQWHPFFIQQRGRSLGKLDGPRPCLVRTQNPNRLPPKKYPLMSDG